MKGGAKAHKAHVTLLAENSHTFRDENTLRLQREAERSKTSGAFVSQWDNNACYVAWKCDMGRIKDMTAEEAALANHEFLSLRRKQLKDLFDRDLTRYHCICFLQTWTKPNG
ncbi:hypothetical protein BC831DRAFT_466188 [Entophlyctis helioformis]|nr:hypothetical protein BC831DRAFT_466188 [Entophlyctis helioformis]